jgi:hypothetical protein
MEFGIEKHIVDVLIFQCGRAVYFCKFQKKINRNNVDQIGRDNIFKHRIKS